jgi:hypothetical protein
MKTAFFALFRAALVILATALASSPLAGLAETTAAAARAERLTRADRSQIQQVISLQLKALARNDDALAFSYSTPETRKYFGSSRMFMDLVRAEYPVLLKHASREFLEAAVIDGAVIQPLRIVSPEGEIIVALYSLARQPDRKWRIAGCELAPSTLQST